VDEDTYSAFISYSHAVDGKLAPSLQRGLHRFAKRWYRLRALRVFRDEASLSTNPGLWSSIQAALADSEFFILLASPEAAQSQWVAREVDYWLRHKPITKLLIVLTDGEVVWDAGAKDFDWSRTSALPETLRGVFAEEPRHLDLRWARTGEHLSLSHPRFRDCVAELAAPLHHRAKDELVGEDVREHRRTVRLTRATIASLTVLVLAASGSGLVALAQRNDARTQRNRARTEARIATSRLLAQQSGANLPQRFGLALLQALKAVQTADTPEAKSSLMAALQHQPHLDAILPATEDVWSVAFSHTGKMLAAGEAAGTVTVWDLQHRKVLKNLIGHQDRVVAVAFSPDDSLLATGADDSQVIIWDLPRGKILRRLPMRGGATTMAFSPDGRWLGIGAANGTLTLWHDRETPPPRAFTLGTDPVTVIAFSENSNFITGVARGGKEGAAAVVDLRRSTVTSLLPPKTAGNVTSAAFNPRKSLLATGTGVGNVAVWDTRHKIRLGTLSGHARDITSMAFDPDGGMLASGSNDGTVRLWDMRTGENVADPLVLQGHASYENPVRSVAFSPDGRTVAAGMYDRTIVLWKTSTQSDRTAITGTSVKAPSRIVRSIAIDRDHQLLATGSDDDTTALWDLRQHKLLAVLKQKIGRETPNTSHTFTSGDIAFGQDGRILAVGSDADAVVLWDVTGRKPVGTLAKSTGYPHVAFSPDGQAVAGLNGNSLALWNTSTRDLTASKAITSGLQALTFSPEGNLLALGGIDGKVLLIDVATLKINAPLLGHNSSVTAVAFSPDGRTLASADNEANVILWDIQQRHQSLTLTGQQSPIWALAFSPDGQILASGSGDNTIALWDMPRRERLATLTTRNAVLTLGFSSQRELVSGSFDATVTFWNLDPRRWEDNACRIAGALARSSAYSYVLDSKPPACQ